MIPWWAMVFLVFGANSTLWGSVGLTRLAERRIGKARSPGRHAANVVALRARPRPHRPGKLTVRDVAVLIPAHNEAVVISASLAAITRLVPRENVHVVSDGSTDNTAELAEAAGVNVMRTETNLGKAGALVAAIERFGLVAKYPVVMLLDADTRVRPEYFRSALPLFDDPAVAAVAGCVRTMWERELSAIGTLLVAHRTRIYAMAQRVLKFGQTYSRVNATYIVPGFASMYRTDVLPEIDMNPPGLVIEDFNMTFELYQKQLGKVGFSLAAVAVTQDPDTFRDYVRQTKRWALGLWQTVRRHPPRANLFSAMLAFLLIELVTSSLIFLLLPLLFIILVLPDFYTATATLPVFGAIHTVIAAHVDLTALLYGIVLPDVALTVLVAAVERRPRLLLGTVFFLFLRVFDAGIALYTLPLAWLAKSDGRWRSPARRALATDSPEQNSEPAHAIARGAAAGRPA
ncbi:MAG TPA: glycosyltransferase family 2 protein [Pseudonocardiaceae bacterium]|nr:glycosyltransferase family 2 protein [Pseudonocardiaceae bacterium]